MGTLEYLPHQRLPFPSFTDLQVDSKHLEAVKGTPKSRFLPNAFAALRINPSISFLGSILFLPQLLSVYRRIDVDGFQIRPPELTIPSTLASS
jgi:hypothetical protein